MKALRLGLVLLLALVCSVAAVGQPTTAPAARPPATTAPSSPSSSSRVAPPAGARVAVVSLEGTIDSYNQQSFERRLQEARGTGAKVIVIQVNTYGGLVTSGLDLARLIKRQDDVYTVAFIDEKAYSAGSMIAVACDEIVMEPNTVVGDCGVIRGDGNAIEGETERAKVESPVMAEFMDSAARNGYAPELLAAFVQHKRVVHYLQNADTGERKFFDATGLEKLGDERAKWKGVEGVPDPLDSADTIFTAGADLAGRIGLSRGTFRTPEELAAARGWVVVGRFGPTFGDGVVGFLAGDAVRGVLIGFLLLSIFTQFKLPGTGVSEAAITISLGLLLVVPFMTGYAQWYEIVAVILGIALIACEIFVIPGFGVAGISGILLLLGGLLLTFLPPLKTPELPALAGVSMGGLRNALTAVVGGMVGGFALWLWVGRYLPSVPYFNRLILQTTTGSQATVAPGVPSDVVAFPALRAVGTALTDLRPGGTARFKDDQGVDQNVDVVSDRGFVSAGSSLTVVEIHGNRVVVRPGGEG